MRLSRRRPPTTAALPGPPVAVVGRPAVLAAAVQVEDNLAERVRLPADILRCVTACVEIAILVALALLAKATASGVEFDVVYASRKLATGLTTPLYFLASIALLVLPIVFAGRLIYRRQFRRLSEAALIGLAAAGITLALDALLRLSALANLAHALAKPAQDVGAPLDAYLAGLVAYITVVGLSGRPRWRTAFWLAIGFYCLASLASSNGLTTVLSLLIALLIGQAVGAGLRFAVGTKSERPTAAEIAGALSLVGAAVTRIRRMPDTSADYRRYTAGQRGGGTLDVTVFDRDQQTADAIYRIWRGLRLRSQVSSPAPLTVERAIEKRALMTYALEDAGVATPRLRALLRVGPEAAVFATDHIPGVTLAELPDKPTDRQLGEVFDTVARMHRRRITHRSLTAEHILLTPDGDGEVILLDPGDGDVAASDLQLRLDLAQLTAALALVVGPERAADAARAKLGDSLVSGLVPLLQPVVLHRSTRTALRRRKDVLPALRKRLLGSPDSQVMPEQLERIRPRTVATLVATIIAAYLVIGEFNRVSFGKVLRDSDWRWMLVALLLSALTYLGAAWSLSGFVLEKLNLRRTLLAQVAASFVTLVTPPAVGGVAVNLRYLRKANVEPAEAAASVGVSQVFAFAMHITLLIIFAALAGTARHTNATHSLKPPGWVYITLAVLVACVLVILAFPAGRRLARKRIAPALGQVIPRLLDIAQRPAKLAEGIGGAFMVTFAYILCLAASVEAVGGHIPLISVAVVFLTGSAVGSVVPTPGGLGAVELALTATLTAAGLAGAAAFSAVILFRLATFYLPVPIGWVAIRYLQRHGAL